MGHLRTALEQNQGVLITPNHPGHADVYVLYETADQVATPFYFMAAWQVFGMASAIRRLILRQHGCFSVDREGTDLRAFRQALEILSEKDNPLVIFPEGEVYHVNERVTPFRDGPAAIALSAARKASRPIERIPCAIKYSYVEDPTPQLLRLVDELERQILWRPRPDLPLSDRIYRFAEGMLALKELDYLGHTASGSLPEQIAALSDAVLRRLEERYGAPLRKANLPERVKTLRQRAIKKLEDDVADAGEVAQIGNDLDDVFFVVQLFSYPGDYAAENPSVERLAETLDKFEEDALEHPTPRARGARRAVISFGERIRVEPRAHKHATAALTRLLQRRVQALLDEQGTSGQAAAAAASGAAES